jgi:vancomycin permeability regulator SanA
MSGDNSRQDYDEVGAMRDRAIAQGVPPEAIVLDHAGFSTYESCYRARQIFGVTRAVLVTQRFHLARALYVCHGLGLEVVGLGDPDWGAYGSERVARYTLREMPALVKAIWQVEVTRPAPTFLGPPEPIG